MAILSGRGRSRSDNHVVQVSVHRFSCAPFTNVESYRRIAGAEVIDNIERLARELDGVRVCLTNSTGLGCGVAELLSRLVRLARALGIDADWRLIQVTLEFLQVTKSFHNALQGATYSLSESDKAIYLHVDRESAKLLELAGVGSMEVNAHSARRRGQACRRHSIDATACEGSR